MALTLVYAIGATFSKCILSMTEIMKRDCGSAARKMENTYGSLSMVCILYSNLLRYRKDG